MGYACPVCETPQADAGHLANHLAITAIARSGDHEEWLNEHVTEWSELDEDTLSEKVVIYAEEAEYPQVFEDTTDDESRQSGRSAGGFDPAALEQLADDPENDDFDVEAIVDHARELTEKRREDSETE